MSSTLTHTKNTPSVRYQDAKGIFFTPYDADGYLGEETLDVYDIVGDTLSITQDDASKEDIPHEFSDTALDESVTMGSQTITMQCLDFQNVIMTNLFGCTEVNGALAYPSEYVELYCMIRVVFNGFDLVLPKVKMDSKTVIENLRSDIGRGELTGTLFATEVIIGDMPTPGAQAPASAVTKTSSPVNYETTPRIQIPNTSTSRKAVYVAGTGSTSSALVYLTDVHEDAA